ncbi:hypothetical protein Q31a_52130 [Aureliella helgolandensis]|uniref:Uncharacterized protein n=1 Tax=Aureliella helgolandensis TaxID=2527968 RepID=A0A518GE07_9BACT|nr:hypothetical protein Q31a_52130 [Aureliella helgolandensis]
MYRLLLILLITVLLMGRSAHAGIMMSFTSPASDQGVAITTEPVDHGPVWDEKVPCSSSADSAVSLVNAVAMSGLNLALDQSCGNEMQPGRLLLSNARIPPKPDLDGLIKPPRSSAKQSLFL